MNSSQPCFASLSVFCFAKYCFTFKPHDIKAYARVILVGPSGLEPPTSCLSGTRSNLLSYDPSGLVWFHTWFLPFQEVSLLTFLFKESKWWRWWDSNPWPPACRAGALPTELHPHFIGNFAFSVFFRAESRFLCSLSVLALSYLPGPLPAKYFHHCRA